MSQPGQASSSASTLPDEAVMNGFHMFTINSLAQAKLEGLLDEDSLASAQGDVMITGPALCLYFAALRSNTTPPSVPIPGTSRSSAPLVLSAETCPPVFRPFFRLWASTVPIIQALPSAQQHDLARVICDKAPLTPSSTTPETQQILTRAAADLRSVAIEITQRRTFQERYRSDLQSALDAGAPGEKRRVAEFAPPPSYDESSNGSHSQPSTQPSSVHSSPQRVPMTPSRLNAALPVTPNNAAVVGEGMPSIESTIEPAHAQSGSTSAVGTHLVVTNPGPSTSRSRPASPTLLPPDAPAINFIRETLYAALAEVIGTHPSIRSLLVSDPSRAYFSSVALSILTVSTDCMTPDGGVITPVGHVLTLQECPKPYQPLMIELGNIRKEAKRIMQEDDEKVILAVRDGDGRYIGEPRMERLKNMLEYGVAAEEERYNAAAVAAARAPAPAPAPASSPSGRNRYNAPTSPPPNRSGAPAPVPVSPNQQAAARVSLEHARRSLENELQQQAPSHLDPRASPTGRLPPSAAAGRPGSPSGSSDGGHSSGRSSGEHAYHSDSQVRTSHESRRRPSAETSNQNQNASPPKKEPKRRSSSEERSSSKGLRGLLRKSKPNNPVPPPVAPKPLPPNARKEETNSSAKTSKHSASPPATASSYTQQRTSDSPVSPTGGGFAGVGAAAGRPSNPGPVPMPIPRVDGAPQLHPNQRPPPQISSPPLQNNRTPQAFQLAQIPPGRTGTPPRAAMMAHQGTIRAAASPYEHALGSGLRLAADEYPDVLSSNNHNPGQRQGQRQATGVANIPTSNNPHSPRGPVADFPSPVPSSAASQPPLSSLNTNPANPPIEVVPSTQPPSPAEPAPRRSMEGSTVQFANRINGLALKLTALRMFQERKDMVFQILSAVID